MIPLLPGMSAVQDTVKAAVGGKVEDPAADKAAAGNHKT